MRTLLIQLKNAKDLLPLWQKRAEQLDEKKALEHSLAKKKIELSSLTLNRQEAENQLSLAKRKASQKESLFVHDWHL